MVYKWLDSRLQRTDQNSDIQPRARPMVAKIFAKAIWGEIAFELSEDLCNRVSRSGRQG